MDNSELVAKAYRGYVIAPAGCGKTHLIAEAVAKHSARRELILTHTNAGVDVLRRRLRSMKATNSSFEIETIAGWALRYALAFPIASGNATERPRSDDEWKQIYTSCSRLLQAKPIREIIRASYSGVYVDEYQDCSVEQHALVCALAEVRPCRIFGDPLQAIFGFKNSTLVDWSRDIKPHFEGLPELSVPWRWAKTSPALGKWLYHVRNELVNKREINLRSAPSPVVKWIQLPSDVKQNHSIRLAALRAAAEKSGTVVAVMRWEQECNKLVNQLSPEYQNIETVACEALMQAADEIESKTGVARMEAVVGFASECLTGINAELKTVLAVLKKGSTRSKRTYTRQIEMDLLASVIASTSFDHVLRALEGLRRIPGTKVWRKELFLEMLRSLREYVTGNHPDLKTAAWSVRSKTRHGERRLGTRVISRTLLIKGLEFDHCVVLDADALPVKDLYVALTRGSKTLTILSKNNRLVPK